MVPDSFPATTYQECSDYIVVSTSDDDATGTGTITYRKPRLESYLTYYMVPAFDIDDIIRNIREEQWQLESPKNRFKSHKHISHEQPYNRRLFINAYKSARSPPRSPKVGLVTTVKVVVLY